MPEFDRNDVTLHYEIDGQGPPLLLLAGMLSDSASFGPLMPLITDHFTVIRPDNRTTGRTRLRDGDASVALMAEDAKALMQHLGINRYHVAGHSMGGLMSLEIAHAAPDQVASATVLASGRSRSPRTMAVFDALLAIRRAPEGEDLWLRGLYPWVFGHAFFENPANVESALMAARAYPHAQSLDAMARQIEAFRAFRPKARLNQINCPTLVMYAGQDLMIPPAAAQPSFQPIPDLTEVTLEGAGHSIVWDATEDVGRHLRAFLTKNAL